MKLARYGVRVLRHAGDGMGDAWFMLQWGAVLGVFVSIDCFFVMVRFALGFLVRCRDGVGRGMKMRRDNRSR